MLGEVVVQSNEHCRVNKTQDPRFSERRAIRVKSITHHSRVWFRPPVRVDSRVLRHVTKLSDLEFCTASVRCSNNVDSVFLEVSPIQGDTFCSSVAVIEELLCECEREPCSRRIFESTGYNAIISVSFKVGSVGYVSVLLGVVEVGSVMARHAHQRVGVDRSHL